MTAHPPAAEPVPARPNIVIIYADDMGYGDAGCYGATRFPTPNIDRLAAEGMRFTDAHSPSSVCTPSRYALLTGRYGFRSWAGGATLVSSDPLLIDPDRPTIATLLKGAGYHTGIIGKWHLGFGDPRDPEFETLSGSDYNHPLRPGPLECGFDTFFGVPMVGQLPHIYIRDHRVEGIEKLEEPLEFVEDRKNPEWNVPWHERYARPRIGNPWFEWNGSEPIKYEHEDLAVRLTAEAVRHIEERDAEQPFLLHFAHRNPHVPWRPHPRFKGTTGFEDETAASYGEFLVELDWSVGEILAALERKGMAENTLVIFTSDNGGAWCYTHVDYAERDGHCVNGPLRGQKTELYEGGHRVPLIVRWPGVVAPGTVNGGLVGGNDFFATFAAITRQSVPEGAAQDSIDMLPLLTGESGDKSPRETLLHDTPNGALAIRKGPWKLIPIQGGGGFRWDRDARDPELPGGQLFHLDEDIEERNNLYEEHPEIVAELQAILEREARDRDRVEDFMPPANR
ncbi:MAG: sulfatase family protein [Opitutales bacterium]